MGKVFIQTYGCQMNEYDTDKMFELLGTQNYTPASTMDEADLVLLNTCSVRDKAEQKVYSELGRMRRLKKQNPNVKIGVGGCVAQQEGVKILKRAENVDFVFGTDNLFELPEILKETEKEENMLLSKSEDYKKLIEERLLFAYGKIRSNVKNGLAIVPIERGAAGGSYFTIPPQVQMEIASRKKIITDEHSGRILVDEVLATEQK